MEYQLHSHDQRHYKKCNLIKQIHNATHLFISFILDQTGWPTHTQKDDSKTIK